jgi:ribosomal protein S4E
MKITSLVSSGVLEFNDLGSYIKGVSPILRSIRLNAGASLYLVETSEVLLSAQSGDIYRFKAASKISVNDTLVLAAGVAQVLTHNFNFQPKVSVVKITGVSNTDYTANVDITLLHNVAFTTLSIASAAGGTFDVRLS